MARFSLGVSPQATRDLRRIVATSPLRSRPPIGAAALQLMEQIRVDPHLKGEPAPMIGYPDMRRLDLPPLRMFFQVRQPPLEDLYVGIVGFSLV